MAFIAQLTDPHIRDGELADAARAALTDAIDAILRLPVQPDVVLVTGDVADLGRAEEYAFAQEALARLPMPVHVLPGNHDDRERLLAGFDAPPEIRVRNSRVVLCDTTIPGRPSGHVDTERLAALLAAAPDTPTIVAMHHPPLITGIPALDAIGLADGDRERLADVLAAAPQVLRVICGHVHRSSFETLGGCGVLTCPSTHLQIEFDPTEDGGMLFVPRGRGFMLHHLRSTHVISHIQATG